MFSRTVPLPDPLLPLAMAIHGALLVAVHAHPPAVVTVTFSDPPAAASWIGSGATVALQPLS